MFKVDHREMHFPTDSVWFDWDGTLMAEIANELLMCTICLKGFYLPKVLPCLHTFCESCLLQYLPPESLTLPCPLCRQTYVLPESGVSGLRSNHFLSSLMKDLQPSSDVPEAITAAREAKPFSCPNHETEVIQLYCESCETGMCTKPECTKWEHKDHVHAPVQDVINRYAGVLRTQLDAVRQRVPVLTTSIKVVESISKELKEKKMQAEAEIIRIFEELETQLFDRKNAFLVKLECICYAKERTLEEQLSRLIEAKDQVENSCSFTEHLLSESNGPEVLMIQKQMNEQLEILGKYDFRIKPRENAHLDWQVEADDLRRSIQSLGSVSTTDAVAHKSVATGDGLRIAAIGFPQTITVTTKNKDGFRVCAGSADLTAHMVSVEGSHRVEGEVVDNKDGTYEVTYTVEFEGEYAFHLDLYGQPIQGSPFRLVAMKPSDLPQHQEDAKRKARATGGAVALVRRRATLRPISMLPRRREDAGVDDLLRKVGSRGREKGEFANVQGICSDGSNIIVADSNNQNVQVFSKYGEFKLRFGVRGRSTGQMQRPTGVTIDDNGDILVADYENRWVSVFTPDGKFKSKIGAGHLMGPKGIAMDMNGHIVVADNKASTVFVFQSNGRLLNKIGSKGSSDKCFSEKLGPHLNKSGPVFSPHYVAINMKGEIIVTDFHNHAVKVFNGAGEFLFKFGTHGVGNGQFNGPTGVAVGLDGNIIVADWGNSRIQVFDSGGSFLSFINTSTDPLYGPQGLTLAIDVVAVADSGNHCCKVYQYL